MKLLWIVLGLAILATGWRVLAQEGGPEKLASKAFIEKFKEDKGVLIDVRTPEEVSDGFIEGAKHMNFFDEDFKERLLKLSKDEVYFVYCRSGGRSGNAARMMHENGYEVYDLKGGILRWKAKNLPLVRAKAKDDQ